MHAKPLFVASSPRMTSYDMFELMAAQRGWPHPEMEDGGKWRFGDRPERYRSTIVAIGTGEWVFAVFPWDDCP